MRIKGRDLMNMPVDKMQKMFDSISSSTNSKVFSKTEERELKTQTLSFMTALKKCGNGHLVNAEMKPIVKEFEKANYDISKLTPSLRLSYEKTYHDLKDVVNEHPGEFKNSAASLYCKAYEFLLDSNNRDFVNKLRNDPLAKKNNLISAEGFSDIESVEFWLQNSDQSSEAGLFAAIGSMISSVNGITAALPIVITILCVILITMAAFVIVLTIINLKYKSELTKILTELTDEDIKNKGSEKTKKETKYDATKNLLTNSSPLTKNLLYKPMEFAVGCLQKITSNKSTTKYIDDLLVKAKKEKSTEGLEQSQEGIFVAIPVIIGIICLIMVIKPIVYFIYNLRMRCSVFFEEEATMLSINIEELTTLRDNAPSPEEKARLDKIISKQRKAMINMAALSNFFYKTTNEAAMKTREDIDDNDRVDYDKIIEKEESITESRDQIPTEPEDTVYPNTPYETPDSTETPITGNSVVLF